MAEIVRPIVSVISLGAPATLRLRRRAAKDSLGFFALLRKMLDAAVDVACEPRNASWFARNANACLVHHKAARVLADPVLVRGGNQPGDGSE